MSLDVQQKYITPEQYLEGEKFSDIRHEYVDGEVYAMSGGSDPHETIGGNLFALIKNQLRGRGCRVFVSGMKARIEKANCFYYPDVMVTCDSRDRRTRYSKSYPLLIVEVLSRTTENTDRVIKFGHYATIESLQEYVLIHQDEVWVERYTRNRAGLWDLDHFYAGDEIHLTSIDFHCPIEALYEDVFLDGQEEEIA